MSHDTSKPCTRCGEVLPLTAFNKHRSKPGGLQSICRVCQSAVSKHYYQASREHVIARVCRNNKANPERVKVYQQTSRERHVEEIKAYRSTEQWRASHRRTSKAYLAKMAKIPGWEKARKAVRRARKHKSEGSYTAAEWQNLVSAHGRMCLACHQREPEIVLVADHVIPLALGGSNYISNIQPLCVACNSRKGQAATDYR